MSESLDNEIKEYQEKAENGLENLALSINLYLVQQGIIENLAQQEAIKRIAQQALLPQEVFKRITEQVSVQQEALRRAAQQALLPQEVFKRITEQVSVQQEAFRRATQQILISSFLPALSFKEILDSFSQLTMPEFMEEDEWKKFEYNWLGFLTVSELRMLYEEWKNGKDDVIRDFFFRMFDNKEKVEKLMEKLSDNVLFDSRMHIISDALDSHVSGKYSLSIPVLIAQIDGIFIEAHKNILKNEKGKSVDYCKECGHPYPVSPNARRISKKLKESNDHFTYIPAFLRFIEREYNDRSKILHGLSKDYPSRDHSTKLILALFELRQALGRNE